MPLRLRKLHLCLRMHIMSPLMDPHPSKPMQTANPLHPPKLLSLLSRIWS